MSRLIWPIIGTTLLLASAFWRATWSFLDGDLVADGITERTMSQLEAEGWPEDEISLDVVCPPRPLRLPGGTFLCEYDDGFDEGAFRVDVLNWRGDIEWYAR